VSATRRRTSRLLANTQDVSNISWVLTRPLNEIES
jgi:hypothetical protein